LLPLTGSQWDEEAIESYEEAMPGYEIIGIIDNSWLNSDALHCRTKGLADLGMLYIDHLPTTGTVTYQETYEINANITACSGDAIYADSVFVFYKINKWIIYLWFNAIYKRKHIYRTNRKRASK